MRKTVELPDEDVALLQRQAPAHSMTVEAWVLWLAREKGETGLGNFQTEKAQSAVARILQIQK